MSGSQLGCLSEASILSSLTVVCTPQIPVRRVNSQDDMHAGAPSLSLRAFTTSMAAQLAGGGVGPIGTSTGAPLGPGPASLPGSGLWDMQRPLAAGLPQLPPLPPPHLPGSSNHGMQAAQQWSWPGMDQGAGGMGAAPPPPYQHLPQAPQPQALPLWAPQQGVADATTWQVQQQVPSVDVYGSAAVQQQGYAVQYPQQQQQYVQQQPQQQPQQAPAGAGWTPWASMAPQGGWGAQ